MARSNTRRTLALAFAAACLLPMAAHTQDEPAPIRADPEAIAPRGFGVYGFGVVKTGQELGGSVHLSGIGLVDPKINPTLIVRLGMHAVSTGERFMIDTSLGAGRRFENGSYLMGVFDIGSEVTGDPNRVDDGDRVWSRFVGGEAGRGFRKGDHVAFVGGRAGVVSYTAYDELTSYFKGESVLGYGPTVSARLGQPSRHGTVSIDGKATVLGRDGIRSNVAVDVALARRVSIGLVVRQDRVNAGPIPVVNKVTSMARVSLRLGN